MKTKIKRFGCEIEGEFAQDLAGALSKFGEMVNDGSIRRSNENDNFLLLYEFVSNVYDYNKEGIREANKIFRVIDKYYKNGGFSWNKTMGFHIHLSFSPKGASDVWSKEFADYFLIKLKEKFKNVVRKRGANFYCKIDTEEKQIANGCNRYFFINFTCAMRKHGTIEFRIFPADEPKKMKRYLHFVFKQVEEFLKISDKLLHRLFEVDLDLEVDKEHIKRAIKDRKNIDVIRK